LKGEIGILEAGREKGQNGQGKCERVIASKWSRRDGLPGKERKERGMVFMKNTWDIQAEEKIIEGFG